MMQDGSQFRVRILKFGGSGKNWDEQLNWGITSRVRKSIQANSRPLSTNP